MGESCSRISAFFGSNSKFIVQEDRKEDLILKVIQMGFHCFSEGLADEL